MRRWTVTAVVVAIAVAGAVYLWTPLGRGGAGVDGPVIHSGVTLARDGDHALIEGIVTLEGDCLYIQPSENSEIKYPTVWPHGTSWQHEPAGVVLPDGKVALLGTSVSGGGGYHSERNRIESVTNDEGTELALRCAEDPYREVAIFNLGSSVRALE